MQLTEEILKRLDALAAKLGTTAEYLWGVLVKQGKVEGVMQIAEFLILVVLTISFGLFTKNYLYPHYLEWQGKYTEFGGWRTQEKATVFYDLTWVGLVVTVIFMGVTLANAFDWVTPMFNPEYWALKQIIG
jgi:hypothetical protein